LPACVVGVLLARNYRRWRRRVCLREPINRAGTAVDLSVGVAFGASRNMEKLAVVGFGDFVHTFGIRPTRKVSSHEIGRRIVGRGGRLIGAADADGENEATRRCDAQGKERSNIHTKVLRIKIRNVDQYFSISRKGCRVAASRGWHRARRP
jgi:hypothetical protein